MKIHKHFAQITKSAQYILLVFLKFLRLSYVKEHEVLVTSNLNRIGRPLVTMVSGPGRSHFKIMKQHFLSIGIVPLPAHKQTCITALWRPSILLQTSNPSCIYDNKSFSHKIFSVHRSINTSTNGA